eukprot:4552365-Lingulodinium_polyedra.AAC.1
MATRKTRQHSRQAAKLGGPASCRETSSPPTKICAVNLRTLAWRRPKGPQSAKSQNGAASWRRTAASALS